MCVVLVLVRGEVVFYFISWHKALQADREGEEEGEGSKGGGVGQCVS